MDGLMVFNRWRQCAPYLIQVSLGPSETQSKMASRSVQPFLHSSRQIFPMLYNGPPFPP